jgi:adenylosuccinate synthase
LHEQVEYESLEGWKEDITNVRSYNELPTAAQRYVERIEELIRLPCQYIGVGPGRDALIVKR